MGLLNATMTSGDVGTLYHYLHLVEWSCLFGCLLVSFFGLREGEGGGQVKKHQYQMSTGSLALNY